MKGGPPAATGFDSAAGSGSLVFTGRGPECHEPRQSSELKEGLQHRGDDGGHEDDPLLVGQRFPPAGLGVLQETRADAGLEDPDDRESDQAESNDRERVHAETIAVLDHGDFTRFSRFDRPPSPFALAPGYAR